MIAVELHRLIFDYRCRIRILDWEGGQTPNHMQ